jgi:hypothetical protein
MSRVRPVPLGLGDRARADARGARLERDQLGILAVEPELELDREPTPVGVDHAPRALQRVAEHGPPRVGLVQQLGRLGLSRPAAELDLEAAVDQQDLHLAAVEAERQLAGAVRRDAQQARSRAHQLGEQLLGNASVHQRQTVASE